MINFKEHWLIFKMLEEPVPLTPDAEMPRLIRLIQDDSPMGRYNKAYSEYKYGVKLGCYLLPIIATHIGKNGIVNDIEWDVSRYEIIGYPVVEGSAEWALYHAINGETVTMDDCGIYKIQDGKLWECFPNDSNEWRVVADDGYSYWLEYIHDNTGWQIYKEPEHESQYKVGDWVEVHGCCQARVINIEYSPISGEAKYATLSDNNRIRISYITRTLSPSEVVIKIGCLRGTIGKSCESACFLMWHSNPKMDFDYSIIRFSALDTQTRELVESLLKAQAGQ